MCKCELVHTREKSNQAIFEHRNIPWSQSWSEKLKIQNEMSSSPQNFFGFWVISINSLVIFWALDWRFNHGALVFVVCIHIKCPVLAILAWKS